MTFFHSHLWLNTADVRASAEMLRCPRSSVKSVWMSALRSIIVDCAAGETKKSHSQCLRVHSNAENTHISTRRRETSSSSTSRERNVSPGESQCVRSQKLPVETEAEARPRTDLSEMLNWSLFGNTQSSRNTHAIRTRARHTPSF